MTSAVKNIDVSVAIAIGNYLVGTNFGRNFDLDAHNDGIGYAPCHESCAPDGPVTPEILSSVEKVQDMMRAGVGDVFDTRVNAAGNCTALPGPNCPSPPGLTGGQIAGIVVGVVCGVAIVACLFGWLYIKYRRLRIQKRQAMEARIRSAITSVMDLRFNVCFLKFSDFKALGKLASHEEARGLGILSIIDTYEELIDFQAKHTTVFCSHQWLDRAKPDPNGVHFPAIPSLNLP